MNKQEQELTQNTAYTHTDRETNTQSYTSHTARVLTAEDYGP